MGAYISLSSEVGGRALIGAWALKGRNRVYLFNLERWPKARVFLLYPRHLCRGVYSFSLSVRPFVCLYVHSFVRSFVLPSVTWNLRQSFALKFLK